MLFILFYFDCSNEPCTLPPGFSPHSHLKFYLFYLRRKDYCFHPAQPIHFIFHKFVHILLYRQSPVVDPCVFFSTVHWWSEWFCVLCLLQCWRFHPWLCGCAVWRNRDLHTGHEWWVCRDSVSCRLFTMVCVLSACHQCAKFYQCFHTT